MAELACLQKQRAGSPSQKSDDRFLMHHKRLMMFGVKSRSAALIWLYCNIALRSRSV